MGYQLTGAVWELTMACNMTCEHCGSSCNSRLDDELTTEEALNLCRQLKECGLRYITLSGGELTTRNDWHVIANYLNELGVITTMITNGWLMDDAMIERIKEASINTVAISIDGLQQTHDRIRREGSFLKDRENLVKLHERGIHTAVITTIHEGNIDELEAMYEYLSEINVSMWQLQIALPMGTFKKHEELYLQKKRVPEIIDFAYSKHEGEMYIVLADCLGYYTKKERAIRSKFFQETVDWTGCMAGKRNVGILANGDIVGCTSIRKKDMVAGNIRTRSFKDIWEDPKSFAWNRTLKKRDLKGFCNKCIYGDQCLGGCSNLKLCFEDDLYHENEYCVYLQTMKEKQMELEDMTDLEQLHQLCSIAIEHRNYQIAELIVDRIEQIEGFQIQTAELHAYCYYQLNDMDACMRYKQTILDKEPTNGLALKGLGLALVQLGDREKGIKILYQSLEYGTIDNYYDLYAVLLAEGREQEAKELELTAIEKYNVTGLTSGDVMNH